MFDEVIVGIGPEDTGRDALALGTELLSSHGKLTLLHVLVVAAKPAPDSGAYGDAVKRRHALGRLAELASEYSVEAQLSCVNARSVRDGLHDVASFRHADLLVIGTSTPDDPTGMFVENHTREVLDDAPCVVAVAPTGYAGRHVAMRKIGVAYDGSTQSEQALVLGRRLAVGHQAELSAFEAVRPPLYIHDTWDVEGEIAREVDAARRHVATTTGVAAEAGSGDAADELAQFSQSVDLLVIGAHKRRPIDHVSEGSTAQQLVNRASSPLLVLPASRPSSSFLSTRHHTHTSRKDHRC